LRRTWSLKITEQRQKVYDTLARLISLRDFKDNCLEYLRIKRENIDLESELDTLQQTQRCLSNTKAQLQDRVRKVLEAQEQEKMAILTALKKKVLEDLKDPKMVKTKYMEE
jgi:vacuolar-type H+-ATPase subunit E/Vma4